MNASRRSADEALAALDARLLTDNDAPLAVALSGGGDSLALLLLAKRWADAHNRRLLALTVDHRLRPEGADWALWCATRAARLGVDHRILVWDGEKPPTGLSAAARLARHRLLANTARLAGARVILMGHTADDIAEAAVMRAGGSSVASPRAWAPSPVWPEGRDIFLLRPLLGVGRAELRAWLSSRGETWIEDPSNVDPDSLRARTRRGLSAGATMPRDTNRPEPPPIDLEGVLEGAAGDIHLSRSKLVTAADPRADLGAALLCAAGSGRPPRAESLTRWLTRIMAGEDFTATLAGARLVCVGERLQLVRDPTPRRRGPAATSPMAANETMVWDGRFEIRCAVVGAWVGHLAGHAARLAPGLRAALRAVAPEARGSLPLITLPDGNLACPTLAPAPEITIRTLTLARLAAARGAIVREQASSWMAKPAKPP